MRRYLLISLLVALVAACVPDIPDTPPQIEVQITVVSDEAALDQAVAAALTSTVSQGISATQTALAQSGVTLTPTLTATTTPTPLPAATHTPTISPTPSQTIVPSQTPLIPNTPAPVDIDTEPQVRVVNALSGIEPVDVMLNSVPVAYGLAYTEHSAYFTIIDDTLRLRVMQADNILVDQLVNLTTSSQTLVLADLGKGPQAYPIHEDISPLPSGRSRVTFFHANPDLINFDMSDPTRDMTLLHDFGAGDVGGPFDIDSGLLVPALADSQQPELSVSFNQAFPLATNTNYMAIFTPQEAGNSLGSNVIVLESGTRMNPNDIPVRFINAAPGIGNLTISINGLKMAEGLATGEITVSLPIADMNAVLDISNSAGNRILSNVMLADYEAPQTPFGEKLIIIYDQPAAIIEQNPTASPLAITVLNRPPRSSAALTNIRLIHALTGATSTLDLEVRANNLLPQENPIGIPGAAQTTTGSDEWVEIISNVSYGQASAYVTRALSRFDARVTISSSGAVQSTLTNISVVPGGSYDLIVLPGTGIGVTRLVLLEPNPQLSILAMRRDNPELINAQINATLTALAPQITQTAQQALTPTPTMSPVPTNTPRPSSTPANKPAAITVNPAPPHAANGDLIVIGEGLTAERRYNLSIDDGAEISSGQTESDGTLAVRLSLPRNLTPGAHILRACVDCRINGTNQEVFAVFIVADPNATSTP